MEIEKIIVLSFIAIMIIAFITYVIDIAKPLLNFLSGTVGTLLELLVTVVVFIVVIIVCWIVAIAFTMWGFVHWIVERVCTFVIYCKNKFRKDKK